VTPARRIEHALSDLGNHANLLAIAVRHLFSVSSLKVSSRFFPTPTAKIGACTVGRCSLRAMAGSACAAVCETYSMTCRSIFVAMCLVTASAALGQNIRPTSREAPGQRPVALAEGREILAAIASVTAHVQSESETDCSHLVHDVYTWAGFAYDYVGSRDLYVGSANFTRVRVPQAGDLVVWRGHVGIILDPKAHTFFSFVRSGPDTQFYDSPYWRSRGIARFFRYVTAKPLHAGRTLQAAGDPDDRPPQGDSRNSENQPPSELSKAAPARASHAVRTVDASRPTAVETSREIAFQVTGKNPSAEEVAAAFVEMNKDSGEALRTRSLSGPGESIIIYRELRVSAVQMKGKRGTALVRIESLGTLGDTQTGSPLRWREQSLGFEKTKRGWVVRPIKNTAYVRREVALQVLSARLADLAENMDTTPQQEREQREIIGLLNLLVANHSSTASAQSN
jgi:hypothetical protein